MPIVDRLPRPRVEHTHSTTTERLICRWCRLTIEPETSIRWLREVSFDGSPYGTGPVEHQVCHSRNCSPRMAAD